MVFAPDLSELPGEASGNTPPLQAGSSLKQPTGLFINAQPYCRLAVKMTRPEKGWPKIYTT
jgi:hypothetical protein